MLKGFTSILVPTIFNFEVVGETSMALNPAPNCWC